MSPGGMARHDWMLTGVPPDGSKAGLQLADDVHDRGGGAQRVEGRATSMPAALNSLARKEDKVLPVAPLPIAAMDVDRERRLGVTGMEVIVALPLLRPVGLVQIGLGGLAIGC